MAVGLAATVAAIPAAIVAGMSGVAVGLTGAMVGMGTGTGREPQAAIKKRESVNKTIPERIFVSMNNCPSQEKLQRYPRTR